MVMMRVKLHSAPTVGISLVVAKIFLHHVPTATTREQPLYSPVPESPYATLLPSSQDDFCYYTLAVSKILEQSTSLHCLARS
jgi:hypothetical protein